MRCARVDPPSNFYEPIVAEPVAGFFLIKKKFLFLRLVGRILYVYIWSNYLLVWLLDSSFNTLFVFWCCGASGFAMVLVIYSFFIVTYVDTHNTLVDASYIFPVGV